MSSSEQAPEPTMDEILASIRKIIADDDQEADNQVAAVEPAAAAGGGQAEAGQANLVDDIANALNQPAGEAGAPAQVEEDIFDLTNEVAATPPQPVVEADAAPVAELGQPDVLAQSEATAPAVQMPPDAELASDPQPQPQPLPVAESILGGGSPADDVLSGTPMMDTPIPEDAAGFDAPAPEAPQESALGEMMAEVAAVPEVSADALEETPVAFEPEPEIFTASDDVSGSADNAVQAIQADADMPDAPAIEMPEVIASEEAPAPAPEPAEASLDTGSFAPEEMADEAGTDIAGIVEESATDIASDIASMVAGTVEAVAPAAEAEAPVEEAVTPEAELPGPAPELEAVPNEPVTEEAMAEEPEGAEPAPGGVDAKSLEDSVKEMLKPMLREWLNENMPRIVQSAVNDEKISGEGGS